jgi:histidine phosphotransferase ChpT
MSSTDLSALVSARLCHDLISPMGAIGNGLELLQMSEGAGADELSLINDSLATALAKLRFFRVAFGPAETDARQSFDEAAQITDGMFHGRFTVGWTPTRGGMSRPTARLAYLAILCVEKSLPLGGALTVDVVEERIELRLDGARTAPPPELWAHVTAGDPLVEIRSDAVQFALLRADLEASGRALTADFAETALALRVTSPSLALV